MTTVHVPILVEPILEYLFGSVLLDEPQPQGWIVDCTLGGGGHTNAILERLESNRKFDGVRLLSVDCDQAAVDRGKKRFAHQIDSGRLEILHARFGEIDFQGREVIGLMADLGFSSDQMDEPERGMSFLQDGPLDMRLDPTRGISCREFLETVSHDELTHVLKEYGQERFARRIASRILQARDSGEPIHTTKQLSMLIVQGTPARFRHGRVHVATRSFQALRIVVNEELTQLDNLLDHVILSVKKGARIAMMSFHSLEDGRVKRCFRQREDFQVLTKKPIIPTNEETTRNSRARSAKLRVAEKSE